MNSSSASGVKMLKLVEVLVSCVASSTRVRYQPPIPSPSRVLSFGGVHVNDPELEMLPVSLAVSASRGGETNSGWALKRSCMNLTPTDSRSGRPCLW